MNLRGDLPDPQKRRHLVLFHILPVILEHPMTHLQLTQTVRKQCGVKGCVKAPEGIFAGWIAKLIREEMLVPTGSQGEHVLYSLRKDIVDVFAILEGESAPGRTNKGGRLHKVAGVVYRKVIGLCAPFCKAPHHAKTG